MPVQGCLGKFRMERTTNPRYGTSCFTNCPESNEAFLFKNTKRLYKNRENMSVNFYL